ncbi:MAG: hypothetical protein ACRC7N_07895 [Clostridium sp.]
MSYDRLLKSNYDDISNISNLLKSSVETYRLLVASAAELNNISHVKKSHVEESLKRVDDVGEIIDSLINTLGKTSGVYLKYCKSKNQAIASNMSKLGIDTEIEQELEFKN